MGKKKKGKELGGLAKAFVDAGLADSKTANKARTEQLAEKKALGRDAIAERERERAEELARTREEEAEQSRQREQERQASSEVESLRDAIRTHRQMSRGNKRWFFVARDGRIPFVSITDAVSRQLLDGHAGIVESLGAVADEHVVVSDPQLLNRLRQHDAELVRFWNSSGRS